LAESCESTEAPLGNKGEKERHVICCLLDVSFLSLLLFLSTNILYSVPALELLSLVGSKPQVCEVWQGFVSVWGALGPQTQVVTSDGKIGEAILGAGVPCFGFFFFCLLIVHTMVGSFLPGVPGAE
jgi:hypothetical protein